MEDTQNSKPEILDRFKSAAISSYRNTSFSPEKRGEQLIKDYNDQLSEDIKELEAAGIDSETINSYKTRYENLFSSWLNAKSRTFSAMITGPANFPTRRHEKANRSEETHYTVFQEWRIRAKKAIIRKAQPVKTFTSELERYRAELARMQRNHEIMKACNVIIKKAKGNDCTTDLMTAGLNEANAHKIQRPDFAGRVGFAVFNLTNNNANMKRIEQRIKELEAKEGMREENPITNYSFEGGTMIINYEIDRIQIFFNDRPTNEELAAWKAKGLNSFNWSPTAKAWQRKITPNALHCVKRMFGKITKL